MTTHEHCEARIDYTHDMTWQQWRYLFGHCADVAEALPEDDVDALGAAAQRRRGAVEGGVAGAENDDAAVQLRQRALARAHP